MNAKAIAAWILGGGVGITILGFAMQFWISVNVANQLAAAGIVPKAEIAIMEGDIEENAEDIIRVESQAKEDSERIESKTERIAQILMEPD